MRGFQNNQGTFFHCSEIGERNWVLKLVSSGDVVPAARNVTKNPSQRLDTGIIPTPWWFTQECEQQLLSIGDDGKLTSPSSSSLSSTTNNQENDVEHHSADINEAELKTKLKTQLEYYFSRENLNQDRYLRSQMDNDQYVLINVVASFPKISHLTDNLDLIIQVLKESKNLQVNDTNTKVRAAHRRTTLLLREIPEFTDEREVKAMFIGCPKYTSLSYGLNNSWYVTFETEEATQLAFLHLQNLRKSFNGKPICVRIKTGPAPLSDTINDIERTSPNKAINDNINGIYTINTSTGIITSVSSHINIVISSVNKTLPNEQDLNLDQLMNSYGYTIRGIYQPKDSEPPKTTVTPDKVTIPEINTNVNQTIDGKTILGPPSTEIVGSMLSAAAEANENKKREKENQMLQYQQIMESLGSGNGTSASRITDTPFIMKPPVLKRYISQESAEVEAAIDIQRAAKKEKLYDDSGQKINIKQQQQRYNNNYDKNNSYNNYDKKFKKNYETTMTTTMKDNYRPNNDRYDSYKQQRQKNDRYYATNNDKQQNYYNNYYKNNNKDDKIYKKKNNYNNIITNNYQQQQPQHHQQQEQQQHYKQHYNNEQNYYNYYHNQQQYNYGYQKQNQQQQHLKPIIERKNENSSTNQQQSQQQQQLSSSSSNHNDNQIDSTRKKGISESSEYNFVDGDFPSLVDKEKIQKEKIKEKAKFSAVVAGIKNEDENKKSYAQTLKKNSTSESTSLK